MDYTDMVCCAFCRDFFNSEDLEELREMEESYYLDSEYFICSDCYDAYNRLSAEEQIDALLKEELP